MFSPSLDDCRPNAGNSFTKSTTTVSGEFIGIACFEYYETSSRKWQILSCFQGRKLVTANAPYSGFVSNIDSQGYVLPNDEVCDISDCFSIYIR